MSHPRCTLRVAAGLLVSWLATSCGGGGPTGPGSTTVASVSVSAVGSTTIPVGNTVQLQAQARNAAGQPIPAAQFVWTSQTPGVAQVSATGLVTGINAGAAVIRAASGNRSAQLTVTVVLPPPPAPPVVITIATLPNGVVGIVYQQTLTATGGDGANYTWTIVSGSLPPGLSLNPGNGAITGVPTVAGTFPFTVRAISAGQTADKALSITISATIAPLQITTANLPDGATGAPYHQTLTYTGGDGSPAAWSVVAGALPPGLTLAVGTGAISGTPISVGTFTFTVRLTVGAQMDDQPLSITVIGVNPVAIANWYLRAGIVGAAYPADVGILASGGDGLNLVYEVVSGFLPQGLVLNPATGAISGTPTEFGTAFFEVRVTSAAQQASRIFALSVSTVPLSGFNIAIVNASGGMPTAAVRAALDLAVAKWESAIVTNLPELVMPTPTGLGSQSCQGHASKLRSGEVIEDLVILTAIAPIDGVGGTVARAGPCGYVAPGNLLWIGALVFDEADLAAFDLDRTAATIIHEIGHVVGIGTLWTELGNALLLGEGGPDPQYTGAAGVAAYQALGGFGTIPVENTGGSGTRDGHWRESVFDNELMTGFLEAAGVPMPLSIISIRSLEDLGWMIDPSAADPYVLPPPGLRAETGPTRTPLGNDVVIERLYRIRTDGRVALLRIPR